MRIWIVLIVLFAACGSPRGDSSTPRAPEPPGEGAGAADGTSGSAQDPGAYRAQPPPAPGEWIYLYADSLAADLESLIELSSSADSTGYAKVQRQAYERAERALAQMQDRRDDFDSGDLAVFGDFFANRLEVVAELETHRRLGPAEITQLRADESTALAILEPAMQRYLSLF